MAYVLGTIGVLVLLYFSRFVFSFIKNIIQARAIGLPTVLVPIDQTHLLWLMLGPPNRHWLSILPEKIRQRLAVTIFGWEFHEKLRPFDRFAATPHGKGPGRSYLLVGLRKLEFWTADPKATQEILLRHRDFEVPHEMEYALGQYGPNVLTTNGDRWTRHRRIITSVIDERISKTVFEESTRQAVGLLEELSEASQGNPGSTETPQLFDMLKKITIHVLLGSGMGTKVPWNSKDQKPEPGYEMTHIDSLTTLASNTVGLAILPTSLLLHWPSWWPGSSLMKRVGRSKVEVHQHSKSILDQERDRRARGEKSTTNDIMSKLLQASEDGIASGHSLSEGEMISNLFIFTAAGFETTATSLAYAMVLLARYPLWQEWLLEEVDGLFAAAGEPDSMDYSTIFPQATRTMAFMLETLRLYSPVPHVHRETTTPQTIETSTGPVRLPAHVRVYVNSVALHLLPSWRDINRTSDPPFVRHDDVDHPSDEYAFRPSRWLNPPGSTLALYHPPKGTWVPWAMGPRVCPGQKMAQVEFTAAMLTLLRRHRIDAVPLDGERQGETEKRLDARLRDSRWVTVLQLNGVFDQKENEGLFMRISKRK